MGREEPVTSYIELTAVGTFRPIATLKQGRQLTDSKQSFVRLEIFLPSSL